MLIGQSLNVNYFARVFQLLKIKTKFFWSKKEMKGCEITYLQCSDSGDYNRNILGSDQFDEQGQPSSLLKK